MTKRVSSEGDFWAVETNPSLPPVEADVSDPTMDTVKRTGGKVDWGWDEQSHAYKPRKVYFPKSEFSRQDVEQSGMAQGKCPTCKLGVRAQETTVKDDPVGVWVLLGLGAGAALLYWWLKD